MTEKLHIDFETRSVVDLKKHGLAVYAAHPSTEVMCMGYAFGNGPIKAWRKGEPFPPEVVAHVKAGDIVTAHNAPFEFAMWNQVLFKDPRAVRLKLEQMDCTMARAYAMALPGNLKMLAQALGVGQQKDMTGHALTMKLCKPYGFTEDGKPLFREEEDMLIRQVRYCMQDVATERACDERMVPLSPAEREVWLWDQKINMRGVGVDRFAIDKIQGMVTRVKDKLNKEIREKSGGEIGALTEASKILAWCQSHGVDIQNLKKQELEDWLDDPDLPYDVREVLEIRADGSKSSLSKLQTALDMALVDGRVRGMFQYHGASTGRFAARGVQLHNLPRPEAEFEDPELQAQIIDDLAEERTDETFIECWYGAFLRVIVSCVRGFLCAAPGFEFIGADLANIEGRVLAWLAGEETKLQAFRDFDAGTGPDLYKVAGARIYKIAIGIITKFQRLIGKVSELSLGYQGGVGAFKSMAGNYGVKVPDEQAQEIVDAWRAANPNIKQYWYDVGNAAMDAVRHPGGVFKAGVRGREVSFRVAGSFLWLMLPSGRVLCYPYPEIQEVDTSWGEKRQGVTFMGIDSRVGSKTKGKWVRLSSYGGKFVENITQAVARDILVYAWPGLEAAGYPIVLHVHDENVSEVPRGFGSVEEYESIMTALPPWATGLPIAAKGFRGRRYRK